MSSLQKAAKGLTMIKDAILETLDQNPDGLTNAEIATLLNIKSHYEGHHAGYLSWSILGLLLNEGRIEKQRRKYRTAGKDRK